MFKSTKYRILLRSALLLLLLSTVVSNTYAYAQEKRVTLNESNTPLKEIFSEISRQTQMYFFADASLLDQEHRYTINVKNGTLDNVLSKLLGSQFNWTFNKNMIRLTQRAIKPIVSSAVLLNRIGGDTLITIKGRIVDEKGNPIPGASVIVAGSKNGTSTSNEGEFILSDVKKNAIIAVSSVAFLTQTIPVQGKTTLQAIVMKPYVSTLDETVIVAYGTTTQRYNTGNVTTIKAADIEKQPVNNPLYALQGRVPGMIITPTSGMAGGSVSVQIRGKNSLNANSEPLYVVDGLPYNNTIPGIAGGPGLDYLSALNFINPADIESIDVLKDADATAIYGSRGANGVIVITTKKGKTGASKVDVSFRNGWMNVNKKLNLLNTRQYIAMRKEALTNDGSIDLLNNPDYESVYPDLMVWDQNRYTDWQKKLIGGT
jgi:TonB-dependent SusC/RagA subfamily outer membrane receptor